ncbi:MAG: zinc ribbon domain-containing protein [Paraglaciecola sp.]|nr:zinc ribbon domain-containing protein [Paraglaciecola sp.]NCT47158.1 zinc ribbon domain-containing protein [Paraglaciecola sp.]
MALIDCPACGKKISDKAQLCSHCNFAVGSASSEDIARKTALSKYLQAQKIQNQSMVAMLLFVGGFGFMYWGDADQEDWQFKIAFALSVLGFVWYIVNRVRLIFVKKSS